MVLNLPGLIAAFVGFIVGSAGPAIAEAPRETIDPLFVLHPAEIRP
jgi:hypothetical protein